MENEQEQNQTPNSEQNEQVNKPNNAQNLEQIPQEPTYCFGHKEDENIWESFLVNKLFAHRGLFDDETPENTLPAFAKAIEKGYAIELDIQPIADALYRAIRRWR